MFNNILSFTKGIFSNQWNLSEENIGTNFWNTLYNNLMKYIFAYNITKLQLIYVTDISIIKEIKGDVKNRWEDTEKIWAPDGIRNARRVDTYINQQT